MTNSKVLNCKITGIAYYLPESILDNNQLARRYAGWDENKIYEKTGIKKRHIVALDEHISDLAIKAALNLFGKKGIDPKDIDGLILCTQTPDYALPATACFLQDRLGISTRCLAFDFNQGCTGFIYGLSIAASMVHSGLLKKVLLITSESYSRWCHPMDKSVTTIFGDAAAAVLISPAENDCGMGPFIFGTDGRGFRNLTVPSSGSHALKAGDVALRESEDESANIRTPANLYMNGPELFRFVISTVPSMVNELLNAANNNIDDIDKFIFHQANSYMLRNIQNRLKIPQEKMIYEMEDVGNTVSASIPIAIERSWKADKVSSGDRLLLAGFGVGYSWAGMMMTWNPD